MEFQKVPCPHPPVPAGGNDYQNARRALYLNAAPAVVAFTGSGGKTTCSEALATAACAAGRRVILTTTTKIRVAPDFLDCFSADAISLALEGRRRPLIVGRVAEDGKKMTGPPLSLFDALRPVADLTVIEADGSRGASVKAYREGEPVLPPHVDRVCVLVGIDALGARRDSSLVHRADRLWPLLGLADDAAIDVATLVRALQEQPAYIPHAATSILINKVDDEAARRAADTLTAAFASALAGRLVRILVRANGEMETVWQRPPRTRVRAVLLAAGASTRFGGLKQTSLRDGLPLVVHAAQNLLDTTVDQVTVVVGHEADTVRAVLPAHGRLRVVHNPRHAEGMSTSLQAGIAAAGDVDGVMIALADMPAIRAGTIQTLLDTFRDTPFDLVAPLHAGRRGHPVLLDRRYFAALSTLEGDVGAAPLLRHHAADLHFVETDDPGICYDVDVPTTSMTVAP